MKFMRRLLTTILLLLMLALALPAQRQAQRQAKQQRRQPSQKEQLQQQQRRLAEQRKANQQRQRDLELQVKKRMKDVEALGSSIDDNRLAMERLSMSIDTLNGNIARLDSQLTVLQRELEERRQHYIKSARYMYRSRGAQKQLLFVLSADNFNQMYRRMRFMNEYTAYQRAQGEAVKQKGEQAALKRHELDSARAGLSRLLAQGQAERLQMEERQTQQQHLLADLQRQQLTVKKLITQQQQQEAELNRQIDKLIAQEIEQARRAAEAARQRQLDEQRRREQEEARQQAATGRRQGNGSGNGSTRRGGSGSNTTRPGNNGSGRRGSGSLRTASAGQAADTAPFNASDPDVTLSGSFAHNKGRLPVPITGSYRVVRRFGPYTMAGVTLHSNGIQLEGQPGAQARCVFDGVVSTVVNPGNGIVVMVRHGRYISVYGNLSAASVSVGQQVKTNQTLGTVADSHVLVFRLQDLREALNPKLWLRKL